MARKLSFVSLGVRDLPRLRHFYNAWGWSEFPDSDDNWAAFDGGGVRLALYPIELLRDEAAPSEQPPPPERWNGITLAINVTERERVAEFVDAAVAAGATEIGEPQDREWGGYSAYVADPEGNRWEIGWGPNIDPNICSD